MRLSVESSEGSAVFESTQRSVTIGRSPDCDVVISDDRVSRRHLILSWDGNTWQIEDSSSGGTWSNGQRFQAATVDQPMVVNLGHADGVAVTLLPEPEAPPPQGTPEAVLPQAAPRPGPPGAAAP